MPVFLMGLFVLLIYNDPTSPAFIASIELGKLNPPEIVFSLDGKTIFAANSEHLRMINVSDPHSPLIVNSIDIYEENSEVIRYARIVLSPDGKNFLFLGFFL